MIDSVLKYASECYEFDVETVIPIKSGSNRVYKFQKEGNVLYLRISNRPHSRILAELDWLAYLQDHIKVPCAIKSKNGSLTEAFKENEKVSVICVFHQLPGGYWDKDDASKWNEATFYNWGKTMGKMHSVTKEYDPAENRLLFEDEDYFYSRDAIKCVPSVYSIMEQIVNEIKSLPRDKDSFGLIHCDMHPQNFLIGKNEINVLDFDDCMYGWFSLDIGIALYHGLWWGLPDESSKRNKFALMMMSNFLNGYLAENYLSDFWLSKIFLFMRYRQINALSWFVRWDNINEVLYNDVFNIQYDVSKNIWNIENGVLFENVAVPNSQTVLGL